jgi:hypothetical protein
LHLFFRFSPGETAPLHIATCRAIPWTDCDPFNNGRDDTMQDHHATQQTDPDPLYLNRADAAAYLSKKFGFRCSEQTLAKLAVKGQGPQFKRVNGRFAVYPMAGLDAWAGTRIAE